MTTLVCLTALMLAQDEKSVQKAAEFLAGKQEKDGGIAVADSLGHQKRGVTALTALAWLACGKDANDPILSKTLFYLLGVIDDAKADSFDYAMSVLALSEALPATRFTNDRARKMLLEKVQKGADTIAKAQNKEGGWGYALSNTETDAETVRVAATLYALRSARKAGAKVGDDTIDRAFKRLESVYSKDNKLFYDRPGDWKDAKFNPSVGANAGSVALHGSFAKKSDAAAEALKWLKGIGADTSTAKLKDDVVGTGNGMEQHGYYELLMTAVARKISDDPKDFAAWHAQVVAKLAQNADGSFAGTVPTYATAMALLVKQVGSGGLYWFSK